MPRVNRQENNADAITAFLPWVNAACRTLAIKPLSASSARFEDEFWQVLEAYATQTMDHQFVIGLNRTLTLVNLDHKAALLTVAQRSYDPVLHALACLGSQLRESDDD